MNPAEQWRCGQGALLVQQGLTRDPHGGDLFVLRGRAGALVKIIWHDRVGMSLSEQLANCRVITIWQGDQLHAAALGCVHAVPHRRRGLHDQQCCRTDNALCACWPEAWLADVLARIAECPMGRLGDLLP